VLEKGVCRFIKPYLKVVPYDHIWARGLLAGKGPPNSSTDNVINDIIKFLAEHYSRYIVEDILFKELRDALKEFNSLKEKLCKRISDKPYTCRLIEKYLKHLKKVIYAKRNEPVRLGEFRVLFNEVYRRVHGDLLPGGLDLALHGIMTEDLEILKVLLNVRQEMRKRMQETQKRYHVGIDYVSLIEYPAQGRDRKVIVPLFIIAKSGPDRLKEVDIKGAVEVTVKALARYSKLGKIKQTLESIPRFTRIILTGPEVEERITGEEVHVKYDNAVCTIEEYQGIPVYSNIACGILRLVFEDLQKMYEEVVNSGVLSNLKIENWMTALFLLAIPIMQVEIVSASSPPGSPGGGVSVEEIFIEVYQEAFQKIEKAVGRIGVLKKRLIENMLQAELGVGRGQRWLKH